MELGAKGKVKRAQIEATIIRADGSIEQLGVVSDSAWRRFSLHRWLSERRIRKANEQRMS